MYNPIVIIVIIGISAFIAAYFTVMCTTKPWHKVRNVVLFGICFLEMFGIIYVFKDIQKNGTDKYIDVTANNINITQSSVVVEKGLLMAKMNFTDIHKTDENSCLVITEYKGGKLAKELLLSSEDMDKLGLEMVRKE